MPHTPVPAAGEAMPAAEVPFITPQAGAVALACAALHRHRVALDALRHRAETEVDGFARAREDMEALIARLIDRLDQADGDPDLEPYLAGSNPLDEDREGPGMNVDEDTELDHSDLEPSLGWTDREARAGKYLSQVAQDDDEPTFGARERHLSPYHRQDRNSDQSVWGDGPTPQKFDDVEEVCEDEGSDSGDREPTLGAAEACGDITSTNRFGWRLNRDGLDQSHWSSGSASDCELDPAEAGIGDADALFIEDQDHAAWFRKDFDGSGHSIARAHLAEVWKAARRNPDEVYVLEPGVAAMFPRPPLCRVGDVWLPR